MNELGAVPRTSAATAKRMRTSEERKARELEGRGWVCYPPEEAEFVRTAVAIVTPDEATA